jgi:cell division protein DivIC
MNERVRRSRGGVVINSPIKRFIMLLFILVIVVLLGFSYMVFNEKNIELSKKIKRIEELEEQISAEEEKIKQLKKQENRVTTDEDIEAIARQELGLIKRDEIVIRPN